jgi:hypothetical protein
MFIGFMKAAFGFRFAPLDFFLAPPFFFAALFRPPPDFRELFFAAFFFVAIESLLLRGAARYFLSALQVHRPSKLYAAIAGAIGNAPISPMEMTYFPSENTPSSAEKARFPL